MEVIKAKTKKWGNSIGVVLPGEVVKKEHINSDEEIEFLLIPKKNPLKEIWGMSKGKFKKSAQEMKDEIRRELHGIG
jgi:antitoxin component of MazEF toxin-antitoxin module